MISVLSESFCTEEYVGHNFLSQDEKIINTYASKYKDSRSERNAIISKKREIKDKIDNYRDKNDDSKEMGKAYVYYFPTADRKPFKEQLEEAL